MFVDLEESGGICGIATRECVGGGMREINFEVVPSSQEDEAG
jgi:hypothetical protein